MTIAAHSTTTGLHLLVDSTGIKMIGKGQWKTKKHGAEYRRQWRKVHLGIDAATLEIRAIEVTDNATGDAPILACLLDQISVDETIASVSGDGAYDTKGCHEAIARRGAQAIIFDTQERQAVERPAPRGRGPQCHFARHTPPWPHHLEKVDRLSSAQPG